MQKITSAHSQPLFDGLASRRIEQLAASTCPPQSLMQSAGVAVARLCLALAPHAQRIWVACGPRNNGGDGFEAAAQLHRSGKDVVITWTGAGKTGAPADARAARARAISAGVPFADEPPESFDFCIDALLGIGATLDPELGPNIVREKERSAHIARWLQVMRRSTKPCLAVDIPSGLHAETGVLADCFAIHYEAIKPRSHSATNRFTLSLLTLKPGLFTCDGRDYAGEVWFDDLGVVLPAVEPPIAWMLGADGIATPPRLHAHHKGSFGDVAVLGGESSGTQHMAGAVLLAASAALHAGAGRVYAALLGDGAVTVNSAQPEIMFCNPQALDLTNQVVVCGCGGGNAIKAVLPNVLSNATRLVLDADALNAVALDASLQALLLARAARGFTTVLTPHPLEAARLLHTTTAQVQSNRLKAAEEMAARYQAVAVLKGSGSVVAAPGQTSRINSTGNALLATPGTGDVLAGMLGAAIASGIDALNAACHAVFVHGRVADDWLQTHPGLALTASRLATAGALWSAQHHQTDL